MMSRTTKIIIAFTGLINVNCTGLNAQSISGKWQNADKNRTIQITDNKGNIEGTLIKSQLAGDSIGRLIITKCSESNGNFNGFINSFDGTMQRKARIRFSKSEPDNLYITIPRLLFFNVKLTWSRTE